MNLSIDSYRKAGLILEYIKDNPGCYLLDVADAVGVPHPTARAVAFQMVKVGALTYEERLFGKGKRYFYQATGTPLPPRSTGFERVDDWDNSTLLDPVDVETYKNLPGILRAITPVILPEARRSVRVTGPTVEQHKLQSAINRKDRARAMSGAIPSGIPVL